MTDKFKVKYQAADGYVGKERPLYFSINSSEIEDDMDDEALSELYYEMVQNDFEQKVCAEGENLEEFLEWARQVCDSR